VLVKYLGAGPGIDTWGASEWAARAVAILLPTSDGLISHSPDEAAILSAAASI